MISPDIIERVRSEIPLHEVIGESEELRKAGRLWKCHCPFHNEKTPSFTIDPNRNTYKCFGCGESGDIFDWLAQRHGIAFVQAVCNLAPRIGVYVSNPDAPMPKTKIPIRRKKVESKRNMPDLPDLTNGTEEQYRKLCQLRSYRIETVKEAVKRGFLRFTTNQWCVLDNTGCNAQMRNLDGSLIYGKVKALTQERSWASWPLGIAEVKSQTILLTEGGPDFIAALEVCLAGLDADPVCLLGASQSIHSSARCFFYGKRVLIASHNDEAGEKAYERWKESLSLSTVIKVKLPRGYDLNDLLMTETAADIADEITTTAKSGS